MNILRDQSKHAFDPLPFLRIIDILACHHICQYHARLKGTQDHIRILNLRGDRVIEIPDTGFCRAIDGKPFDARPAFGAHSFQVIYGAIPLIQEAFKSHPGAENLADKVSFYNTSNFIHRDFPHWILLVRDSRIVHPNINSPKLTYDLIPKRLNLIKVVDNARNSNNLCFWIRFG